VPKRPPPLPDDLAQLALERIREALERRAGEKESDRLAREAAREARRRERKAEANRQFFAVGVALLVGGLVFRLVHPVAAVGLAFVAAAITVYLMKNAARFRLPRAPASPPPPLEAPSVTGNGLPESRRQLVEQLVGEATDYLRRMEQASGVLIDPDNAGLCARLVGLGAKLTHAVAQQPGKLPIAQRVFTYHLPKAVYLAETLVELQQAPDAKRAGAARHVLGRMEMLFERTLLDLVAPDAAEMDLEIRLINQALDEDLDIEDAPKAGGAKQREP
jgi:hypothetical protein